MLLAWYELDEANAYHLLVMALGPHGEPRAPPTALGTFEQLGPLRAVVADDGQRALLVLAGDVAEFTYGIHALPLSCVP